MLNAYLTFEAMIDHGYEFSCVCCGYHPKVLIHDLTKKSRLQIWSRKSPCPTCPRGHTTNSRHWPVLVWCAQDILHREWWWGREGDQSFPCACMLWEMGSQHHLYIGPQTRDSRSLHSTEYEKVMKTETGDHNPIPDTPPGWWNSGKCASHSGAPIDPLVEVVTLEESRMTKVWHTVFD